MATKIIIQPSKEPIKECYGTTCIFHDHGHIGIKWYIDRKVRNECMKRQFKWAKVGYAPLVFGKIDDDCRGYKYGYYTELVTPMVEVDISDAKENRLARTKNFAKIVDEIAFVQKKYRLYDVVSDLLPRNIGDRYGQWVPIDFD